MSDQETGAIKEEPTPIPLAEFLEGSPPGNKISVTDLAEPQRLGPNADSFFAAPDIQLHCGCDSCNGTMFFRWTAGRPLLKADRWHFFYVTYRFWVLQDTAVPSHRVQGRGEASLVVSQDEPAAAGSGGRPKTVPIWRLAGAQPLARVRRRFAHRGRGLTGRRLASRRRRLETPHTGLRSSGCPDVGIHPEVGAGEPGDEADQARLDQGRMVEAISTIFS